MNSAVRQQFTAVADFFEAVEPLLPAYRHGLLSHVAVVHEGVTAILGARLRLSVHTPPLPKTIKQTLNLRAGQQRFEVDTCLLEPLIEATVLGERLPISANPILKLLPHSARRFSAYHQTTIPTHRGASEDPELLQISGIGREFMSTRQRELSRELNEMGFDSLDELLRAFELSRSGETAFEIVAAPVAHIASNSHLRGRQLQLVAQLGRELDTEKFRVTVRNADRSRAVVPHSFTGSEFDWTVQDDWRVGSLTHTLEGNEVAICRAVYAGRIQNEVRLGDPSALPNPRRMILNVIDPQLTRLQKLLTNPTEKQRDDFETAIGLLLQVLGFAPAPFGKLSGMGGEPDIFVEGNDGEMLVVECTSDVPDDDKLMKLVSRTARARDELARSLGVSAPLLIPMLVIPLPPDEFKPILEKAAAHDVIVLGRPEIEAAIARTDFAPNARETLLEWRKLRLTHVLTHGIGQ
jgi:hypothetical protein